MDMSEFLASLIPFIAFAVGYIYREFRFITDSLNHKSMLEKQLKETDKELNALGVKDVKQLKHEIINGTHYFFTETDDTFVGQGKTLEEAAKHYESLQGKDILGWFKHHQQEKNYCFVNGKCMEFQHEQL